MAVYSSQTQYELARARKFITSIDGLKGKFSVSLRIPKPSPNKIKYPYYVLIEKSGDGHTKTVNKAYSIEELMGYFTAGDAMMAALWANTRPDRPDMENTSEFVNYMMGQTKSNMEHNPSPKGAEMQKIFDSVKAGGKLREFTPAEQKQIKLDLKRAQTFLKQQGFIGKYKIGYSNIPNDKLYYMNTKNLQTGQIMNVAAANSIDELMSYFWKRRQDADYKRLWEQAKQSVRG